MNKKTVINVVLLIVSVKMLVLAIILFTWTREEPPFHLALDMDQQPKMRAQDGTMMAPPEGTVSYGNLKADTTFYQGKDASGKLISKIPVKVDDLLLMRGRERFNIFCAPCHDEFGSGIGMAKTWSKTASFAFIPDIRAEHLKKAPDGHFFDIITNGKGIPGAKTMPSYSSQIEPADRWAIVAYIRALQKLNVEVKKAVEIKEITAEKGKALFMSKGCFACHSVNGTPLLGPTLKGLWASERKQKNGKTITVDEAHVIESIREPNKTRSVDKTVQDVMVMAPMDANAISDDEIRCIIEYMKTLK